MVNPFTYKLKAREIYLVELREGRTNYISDGSGWGGGTAARNFSANRSVFRAGKIKSVLVLVVCRRRFILRVTKHTFEWQGVFKMCVH